MHITSTSNKQFIILYAHNSHFEEQTPNYLHLTITPRNTLRYSQREQTLELHTHEELS